MSWRHLTVALFLFISSLSAADLLPARLGSFRKTAVSDLIPPDPALWREFGFLRSESAQYGRLGVTAYQLKDTTGGLAAWEWLRSANMHPCRLASFCATDGKQAIVFDGGNYVLRLEGAPPAKAQLDVLWKALPDAHETSLPAILTFVPRQSLVPNSARYILGPVSLQEAAPELQSVKPGFEQGAEGHLTSYNIGNGTVRLALFYFPTPEMARLRVVDFKLAPNVRAKRSGVLVAAVLGASSDQQADTLLSRIQYEARITWNDVPPPSPIKPLYQLLSNILIASGLLSALALVAGLIYAAMRIYRRRYGQLESEEAMTTLNLSGE
jgi:hypothetical protein